MTEQEKQEIITEVKKSVMDEMKDKIVKEDTQKTLKIPREKWYGERFSHGRESAMVQAFDTPYMAWEAWDHIRRLTCLVCGVRYVRQLEENQDAERICDEICQKIYDLRIELTKSNDETVGDEIAH